MHYRAPIEIPEAKAQEIAEISRNGPRRNVIMSFGDKWYDIRHMSDAEVMTYVCGLTELRRERLN
jgi:hypothetical protein